MSLFSYLKLSEQENNLINDCYCKNINVKNRWYFSNLLVPSMLILLTIIFTVIARLSEADSLEKVTPYNPFDVLYNAINEVIFTGGITLIGINTLTIMAGYVIGTKRSKDFDKNIEERHKPKKVHLDRVREKLHDFSYPLLIIGSFVYVTQIIYKPKNIILFLVFLFIIILVLRYSLRISLQMYMTKDELFLKTYEKSMADHMKDTVTDYTKQLEEEEENND